jgi:hypothetical protein
MKTKTNSKKKATPSKKRSVARKSAMSGYVVLWRHTMDDVPIGLYASEDDAMQFAETCSFRRAYKITRDMGIDCSTPICFGIVPFVNGVAQDFLYVPREDDR